MLSFLMVCAAGEFQTVEPEGLQAVGGMHTPCSDSRNSGSSSSSEAEWSAGKHACSNSAAGEHKAAPGPAGTGRPAKAVHQAMPPLTWADAQQMLDVRRVTGAAAALDGIHKEAERAKAQSKLMLDYLQTAGASLPSCFSDAEWEAELLYHRARAWQAAQEDTLEAMVWAESKIREQWDGIRQGWESKLSMTERQIWCRPLQTNYLRW